MVVVHGPGEEAAYTLALVDAVAAIPGVDVGLGDRAGGDVVVV
jgi:hypothetical protein